MILILLMAFFGIPFLPAGILLFQSLSFRRETHNRRLFLYAQSVCGFLLCVSAGFVGIALILNSNDFLKGLISGQMATAVSSVLWVLLTFALAFIALVGVGAVRQGLRNASTPRCSPAENADYDIELEPTRTVGDDSVTLGCTLILMGLLSLATVGTLAILFLIVGAAYLESRQWRRTHEFRLLSLLAVAAEHDLPLAAQLECYADSLRSLAWIDPLLGPLSVENRKRRLHLAADHLLDGGRLSEALTYTQCFSLPLLSQLAAAEFMVAGSPPTHEPGTLPQHGAIPQILRRASQRSQQALRPEQFDMGTWFYLTAVASCVCLILSFMCVYIIPKMREIGLGFGLRGSWLFNQITAVSDVFYDNWYALIGLPFGFMAAVLVAIIGFVEWDRWNVPLLMRWFPGRDSPQLLRAIAQGIRRSQPVPELLDQMTRTVKRSDLSERFLRIAHRARQGVTLGTSLAGESFLSPREAYAINRAEQLGNLDFALDAIADQRVRGWQRWFRKITTLGFPLGVICIGLAVGAVGISMFTFLVDIMASIPLH